MLRLKLASSAALVLVCAVMTAGLAFAAVPFPAGGVAEFAGLAVYRAQDEALAAQPADAARVVFFGDSITEGWDRKHTGFFVGGRRVNRGISGQTTAQMLLRFRQDVIDLTPRAVVILAGTNDIAGNAGPVDDKHIVDNLASLADIAHANRIRVVMATLLPTDHYGWAPDMHPAERVRRINVWIRKFAHDHGYGLIDYASRMDDGVGGLRRDLTEDGVHPNAAGYAVMEAVAAPVLKGLRP